MVIMAKSNRNQHKICNSWEKWQYSSYPLTDRIFSEEATNCYTHFVKTSTSLECPFCKAKSNGVAPSSLGNANADDPPGWAAKNCESLANPNFITRWRRVSLCFGSKKNTANKQNNQQQNPAFYWLGSIKRNLLSSAEISQLRFRPTKVLWQNPYFTEINGVRYLLASVDLN